jgi:hypothetical protein
LKALQAEFNLKAEPDSEGLQWVKATPKQSDGAVQVIRVGLKLGAAGASTAANVPVLTVLEIVDGLGQTSRLNFQNFEANVKLLPETFQFKAPAARAGYSAMNASVHLQQPLAERLRPRHLGEVIGQQHLIGEGLALRLAFESGQPHSCILWGPPGVGKTTIARLMADAFDAQFISISAVLGGVKDIREAVDKAEAALSGLAAAKNHCVCRRSSSFQQKPARRVFAAC